MKGSISKTTGSMSDIGISKTSWISSGWDLFDG